MVLATTTQQMLTFQLKFPVSIVYPRHFEIPQCMVPTGGSAVMDLGVFRTGDIGEPVVPLALSLKVHQTVALSPVDPLLELSQACFNLVMAGMCQSMRRGHKSL